MKLISLNIEGDNHLEDVKRFVVSQSPDIVCFNEAFEGDVAFFERTFGMQSLFIASEYIAKPNPFRLPPRGNIGTCILTKGTIQKHWVDTYFGDASVLPELTAENGDAANRFLAWAEISLDNVIYRIVTTHFTITKNAVVSDLQRANAAKMISFLDTQSDYILCGDFNTPRGAEIYTTLATKLHDNIPADVITTLDPNLHRAGSKIPNIVVDGLFTTPGYTASDVQVVPGISDHCAITAMIEKVEIAS